jgi:hypothetical protein
LQTLAGVLCALWALVPKQTPAICLLSAAQAVCDVCCGLLGLLWLPSDNTPAKTLHCFFLFLAPLEAEQPRVVICCCCRLSSHT